jgi:hypothetical protein
MVGCVDIAIAPDTLISGEAVKTLFLSVALCHTKLTAIASKQQHDCPVLMATECAHAARIGKPS